ncbi:condensation domain-containing protein [Streptomyces sp. NPDC017993]|uniref:condensation domain-containing protein n=1 Tax=Streptomyces sp. NPDC017993 TaxID=3365027 RepID=UPI0037A0AAE8
MALPVTAPSPTHTPDAVRGHRAAAAGLPLTTAQAGLWRRQALDPGSPALNSAECIEIHGPLDPVVFAEALHRTVGETDALRVRIEETPHGPRQLALAIEAPGHGFPLQIASLLDQGDPDAVAGSWMRDDLGHPFDLGAGPLFRHALFQVGERRWLWYQRVHRLALDSFGHALVTRRAAEIYSALAAGEEAGASPFGRLAGLVAEDAAYRTSEAYAADRAHWNRVLAGCPETPTLAGRRALPSRTFLRRTVWISTEVTRRIEALAGAVRATWPEVLIAAQACYHARATRTADVVLGLPMRGRMSPAALRVPGTVSHVLPLRLTVGPRATFADLTRQVVLGVRAARRHQRYPYEDLRRDLGRPGTAGAPAGPLVNVLPFDHGPDFAGAHSDAHNLSAGPVDDLTVHVYDRGDAAGLRIDHDANPALYGERELAAHQDRFLDLLGRIADTDPHAPLPTGDAALARVPRRERHPGYLVE